MRYAEFHFRRLKRCYYPDNDVLKSVWSTIYNGIRLTLTLLKAEQPKNWIEKLDRKMGPKNWTEKLNRKIEPKNGPKKLDLLGLVNFEPIGSGQSACQNRTNLHFLKIFQII